MATPKLSRLDFEATDDADWAIELTLTNDDDNTDYDALADLEVRLSVVDEGSTMLDASTEAGSDVTITRPADNQISWRFTAAQMASLCAGRTYALGCVVEDSSGNITQLFVGSLAVIDGGFA